MKECCYDAIVIEDMVNAQKSLKKLIATRPELRLVHIANTAEDALHLFIDNRYDLIFLDVNLPTLSGIEFLEELGKKNKVLPYVIFTTAYDSYAIKAFEYGALDYLLKPITVGQFNRGVDRFLKSIKTDSKREYDLGSSNLIFKENRKQHIVPFKDIIYVSSAGTHTVIHTEERDFEIYMLIKDVEARLPVNLFMRIHKQYVVNIEYIREFEHILGGQYQIHIADQDETILPVSRNIAPEIKELLKV